MAMKARVSITDVAKEAGVSIATVSRVLNKQDGDIKISSKTRGRVLEVVERLGYQRNPFAVALRTERTGVIGGISSNIGGTYMSQSAQHVQDAAHKRGVELLFGAMRMDMDGIKKQIDVFQSQLFDGILFLGNLPNYQAMIHKGQHSQKPFVTLSAIADMEPPLVKVDSTAVIEKAMEYLSNLGHTKIAFLGSELWPSHRELLNIFKNRLASDLNEYPSEYVTLIKDFPYTPWEIDFADISHAVAAQHAQSLLQLTDPPTAIFCVNDGFAAAAIKGILRLGLRVPDDVSIIGFGGETHAAIIYPGLTTVQPPHQKMAEAAVDLLLSIIENPNDMKLRSKRILVDPKIVVRESCAPPSH